MSNNRWDIDGIENLGHSALPPLPPELRARTLTRCAGAVNKQQRQRRQRGWALVSTFVGVCIFHWAAISALNVGNVTLNQGNTGDPASARFAMTPDQFKKLQQQRAQLLADAGLSNDAVLMHSETRQAN